jgi:hypothetical protein
LIVDFGAKIQKKPLGDSPNDYKYARYAVQTVARAASLDSRISSSLK